MKSLIVYFSRTDENYMEDGIRNIEKGNTEIVAETIQKLTGADLFKVETVNEYPYDYYKCCDVAKEELENNERPNVKRKLDNIDDYDVIYIGGPVWWSHYPMAIFTALEGLDFTGKKIKPFTTHEGSGIGSVMEDIRQICKNAVIEDAIAIRGSDAKLCEDKIKNWI